MDSQNHKVVIRKFGLHSLKSTISVHGKNDRYIMTLFIYSSCVLFICIQTIGIKRPMCVSYVSFHSKVHYLAYNMFKAPYIALKGRQSHHTSSPVTKRELAPGNVSRFYHPTTKRIFHRVQHLTSS